MNINMDGPLVIETAQDAQALVLASLAAMDYVSDVAEVPGPTVGQVLDGQADVHLPTAERCLDKYGADMQLFAWLMTHGFGSE